MTRKYRVAAAILGLSGLTYLFVCTSFPFFPDKSGCMTDKECLTQTHWQQMGGFEKFTPDSLRTGCWSTALAQIAYFHKLKPFGKVNYRSRQGYVIDEKIDSLPFDFNLFAPAIHSATPPETVNQMARYNYYAALAVRKDFGTDRYMNKLAPADLLEEHYRFKVKRYIAWRHLVPNTLGKLEKIIYQEINAKRPVFLHFADLKNWAFHCS